jgi:hypothetical protein
MSFKPTNSAADEDDPFMSAKWFQITSQHGALLVTLFKSKETAHVLVGKLSFGSI